MTHLTILPDARVAGRCTAGTSDKDWAACLAIEQEQESTQLLQASSLDPTTTVVFLCVHGKHGAALRQESPQRFPLEVARKLFAKKWKEKTGKGYRAVPFESLLPAFGQPYGWPLHLPGTAEAGEETLLPFPPSNTEASASSPPWRYTAALLKAISLEEMQTLLADPFPGTASPYALSEKANGERCLVEFDGKELRAYNRKGLRTSAPPEGARVLCTLGHSFVIDGERLIREQAGHFVVFDVLEWNGESLLALPYRFRLTRLVRGLQRAGVLKDDRLTPTLRQAQECSTIAELRVLLAISGAEQAQAVIEEVQAAGGEGVVLRNLDALYAAAGFKYKFLADIDAFVFGIAPGVAAGSLKLGMVRPADGAVIDVGRVRSGLNDQDVEIVRRLLAAGAFPVFRIRYLPASTIGITLVQPQTSGAFLRTDKAARECTTDQFGREKAALIATARPIAGITV